MLLPLLAAAAAVAGGGGGGGTGSVGIVATAGLWWLGLALFRPHLLLNQFVSLIFYLCCSCVRSSVCLLLLGGLVAFYPVFSGASCFDCLDIYAGER